MEANSQAFGVGDRIRLSRLGTERMQLTICSTGTVVGRSTRTAGSVRVLFDGLRTAKTVHRTYIELADET
jgi:hypothetical protein